MHIHIRVHRWVLWWFYVGVVCGAVAVINILSRNLSRGQEQFMLVTGVLFWVLGGLVCYACEGIRIEKSSPQTKSNEPAGAREEQEWHAASDFLIPGNRKSLLPPRH